MTGSILTPAPGITWSTEQSGLHVVDEARGRAFHLTGLAEMLWECLNQHFTYEQIIEILGEARAGSQESTERKVWAILREWKEAGLFVFTEGGGRG